MTDPKHSAFERFLIARDKDIRRISRHTRGEFTPSDVQSEAWLITDYLPWSGDIAIDLGNTAYQETLLSHLYQRLVRYTERTVRHALRLDQQDRDEAPADRYDLLNNSSNGGTHDPLALLIAQESTSSQNDEPNPHQSLASAYLHLLRRHGGRVDTLAGYLLISTSHCYRCCSKARHLARCQRTLCMTPSHDQDDRALKPWRKFRVTRIARQLDFEFHEAALC